MGFEEVFVFMVLGCVAVYYRRSLQPLDHPLNQAQTIFLWILAIVLPSLAIAWTMLTQVALPLIFVATGFLLCLWIYSYYCSEANLSHAANLNLSASEEKQLKNCFPSNIYQLKDLEYRPQEIYCRGHLRSRNYKYAYDTISQSIQKIFGDRFICYLQEVPVQNLGTDFGANLSESSDNQQNSANRYCFYLALPSNQNQALSKNRFKYSQIISITSIVLTAFTVLIVGANIHQLQDLSFPNLQQGLVYFGAIASIFMARAIARYYITKKHHLRFDPPLLLPCIDGFGLLGSLNINPATVENPTNQRRILFDLAISPTIAGLGVSIILLLLGNWLLIPPIPNHESISPLLNSVNTFDFKNSILATCLQAIFSLFKSGINTNNANAIQALSPLSLAGLTGLALNALQLMPFDLLDGGNLAIAMFGYRQTIQIARISRLLLLAIALLVQPWLKIYSLLFFLLPMPRPLILNESLEIDRNQDLIGITLMAIALLILLPVPKSVL